jgi:hypothetical protein
MAPLVAGTCLSVYSGKIAWQAAPKKINWQRSVPGVSALTAKLLWSYDKQRGLHRHGFRTQRPRILARPPKIPVIQLPRPSRRSA